MIFKIGTVLTISHGTVLTDMQSIYNILNYMLTDRIYTHQIPRALKTCEKYIIEQHPQLKQWDIFNKEVTNENYKEYLKKAEQMFGTELEINKVPDGVWIHRDATEEAEELFGKDNVITLDN